MTVFARVADLAEQIRGVTYAKEDAESTPRPGYLPILRAGNIADDGLLFEDLVYVPAERIAATQKVRRNDVVIAASSGSLDVVGKAARARADFEGGFGAFCKVLRPGSGIDPAYFAHFFRTREYRQRVSALAAGANINNLRNEHLDDFKIPVPPLPEQRRIAELLDKADTLRTKRRAALAQLDTLTQAIFLDMFGDPATNPKGWAERLLGEVFEVRSSRRVLESQWQKKGVPFYRAREIVKLAKDGYVDNDLFISEELFNELSRGAEAPKAGDLMVSAVGTLGACYQVRSGDRFYFKDASVLHFIPQGEVEPAFVRHAFGTNHVLRQINSGSGSTVGTYTIARARETRLYIPPLTLQQRFARILERVQCAVAMHNISLKHLESLFASLQFRAFRAEL